MKKLAEIARRWRAGAVAFGLALVATTALHAAPPTPLPSSVVCNTCSTSLAVTASSARVALPTSTVAANTALVYNAGTKDLWFAQGDATVTATASTSTSVYLPAGSHQTVWLSGTYIAAITAGSDTTTLKIWQSNGPIDFGVVAGASGAPTNVTGTFTNRSGTVATGGTSQTLAASNASRKRLIIQNPCSATESLFINFTTAASTSAGNSLELVPCGSYDTAGAPPTTEQVNVTAATTSHAFVAKEM
jgi:hypothetical protein